jgi:hypothetical protein
VIDEPGFDLDPDLGQNIVRQIAAEYMREVLKIPLGA